MSLNMTRVGEKELKALFIRGPGVQISQEIIKIFIEDKDSLMIGDGQHSIDLEYIRQILKENDLKITKNTRIDINAHGARRSDKKHIINLSNDILAEDVFKKLREIAGSPLYVHLWSCYSGTANKEVKALGDHSILVTHIESKEAENTSLANYSINASLKRYLDPKNNNLTPHQQFLLDLTENFQAATFNQSDGEIKFKFTRIPKEKNMPYILEQIEKHETLEGFINDFFLQEGQRFQKTFPEVDLQGTINSIKNISQQEVKNYAAGVLVHAFSVQHQNQTKESLASLLEKLTSKSIDLNYSPDNDLKALHWAVVNENREGVNILLKHGADVNSKDLTNNTPLHYACSGKNNAIIKSLLAHGADVNSRDIDNNTALSLSISKGNFEAVDLLLENQDLEVGQAETTLIINHKVKKNLIDKGLIINDSLEEKIKEAVVKKINNYFSDRPFANPSTLATNQDLITGMVNHMEPTLRKKMLSQASNIICEVAKEYLSSSNPNKNKALDLPSSRSNKYRIYSDKGIRKGLVK